MFMPKKYKDGVMLVLNKDATLLFIGTVTGDMLITLGVTAFDECMVDRFYNDTDQLMRELKVYPFEELCTYNKLDSLNEDWFLDHIIGGISK